jgi:hypothetical protein
LGVDAIQVRTFLFGFAGGHFEPVVHCNVADNASDRMVPVEIGKAAVGNAYSRQAIVVTNQMAIRSTLNGRGNRKAMGCDKEWHNKIERELGWVVAAPVFDPADVSGGYTPAIDVAEVWDWSAAIGCGHVGAVVGVVSVDLACDTAGRHPREEWRTSSAMRSLGRHLMATSFAIGQIVSGSWEDD